MVKPRGSNTDSTFQQYIVSASASITAETVTYPLDITKTRLQIQGETTVAGSSPVTKRGMFRIVYGIVTEEGLFKLWQGLSPAIYRQAVYSGIRMPLYEKMKSGLFTKEADGSLALWKLAVCSGVAGSFGQFCANPTDLIKIRMQMEGRRRLEGKPVRVKNFSQAFRTILAEEGVYGLWRGWVPNVQRAALINIGEIVTYDFVKRQTLQRTSLQDNYVVHISSSSLHRVHDSIIYKGMRNTIQPGLYVLIPLLKNEADTVDLQIRLVSDHLITRIHRQRYRQVHGRLFDAWDNLCAGFMASVLCTPADVLKSRVMNQPIENGRGLLYRGTADCFIKTIRQEGPLALYKGFLPGYCRMAPWSLTFWVTYEKLRAVFGHTPF